MKKIAFILTLSGVLLSALVQAMDTFQQNGRWVDEGAARRFVPGAQLQQPAQPVQPHVFQPSAQLGGWGTTQQPIATTGVQPAYSAPQASPFGYGQQPTAQATTVQPHVFQQPMQPFAQQPVQSTWGAPMQQVSAPFNAQAYGAPQQPVFGQPAPFGYGQQPAQSTWGAPVQQVSAAVQPSVDDEERERFIKRVVALDKEVKTLGGYGIHAEALQPQETLRHKESVKRTFKKFKEKSTELMALFEEGKKKNYFRENGLKSVEKATARIKEHKAHYKAYGANLKQAVAAQQQAEQERQALRVQRQREDQRAAQAAAELQRRRQAREQRLAAEERRRRQAEAEARREHEAAEAAKAAAAEEAVSPEAIAVNKNRAIKKLESILERINQARITQEASGYSLDGEGIMFYDSGIFPMVRAQLIAATSDALKSLEGFEDLAIPNISLRVNAANAEGSAKFPNTHAQVLGWLQSKQDRYVHLQGYCSNGLDRFIRNATNTRPYQNMFYALALLQRVEQKVNPSEAFDTLLNQAFGLIEDQLNPQNGLGLNCGTGMNCRAFLLRTAIMKFLKDQRKFG